MTATHEPVLAHAFGQRYELPVPLLLFVLGGALVVAVSFLFVLRRQNDIAVPETPDEVPTPSVSPALAAASVLLASLVAVVGLTGTQNTSRNLAPTLFWLVLWIVVPLSCGLLGDWTVRVNPFANAARLCSGPRLRRVVLARSRPLTWPARLGNWPAVALFVLLVLGELVFNRSATKPAFVGTVVLLYLLLSGFAGMVFGPSWQQHGEVFTQLFDTWGRLGRWRRHAPGRAAWGGGLDTSIAGRVARVVFVLLLLISVNFDGLLATPQWNRYELRVAGIEPSNIQPLRVVTLAVVLLVILAVFALFATASARAGGFSCGPVGDLAALLPSLIPIAYGYLVAHYLQYLITNGQLLIPEIGNPGYDNWPLQLPAPFDDSYLVDTTLLPNSFYWYVSLSAIVAGHVAAVLVANRAVRARAADRHSARRAELPWLVAMIGYTTFSLFLVAQPLTENPATTVGAAGLSQLLR